MNGIIARLRNGAGLTCKRSIGTVTLAGCVLGLSMSSAIAAGDQDRSFLTQAMQDNVDLRSLADLAEKRIGDPRIKQFARDVSQRSSNFDSRIAGDVRSEAAKQPSALSLRASDQYNRIQAQNGRDAADEFLRDIAIDARISQDDYNAEAQSGSDPSLKRLASTRATELERIAKQADSLRGSLR